MTRYAVGVALGLLLVPSIAQAQTSRLTVPGKVSRPFSNLTFDQPSTPPNLRLFARQLPSPTVIQDHKRSTRPAAPALTPAPVQECRMPVVSVDPSFDSRMPVVEVDERPDPRMVLKVPACQPRD